MQSNNINKLKKIFVIAQKVGGRIESDPGTGTATFRLSSAGLGQKLYSSGIVEGLNNKTKVTIRKSCGFSTFKAIEITLSHQLGNQLPEPQITHKFW